jgi:P4 family phage/plasmid primase-like protien
MFGWTINLKRRLNMSEQNMSDADFDRLFHGAVERDGEREQARRERKRERKERRNLKILKGRLLNPDFLANQFKVGRDLVWWNQSFWQYDREKHKYRELTGKDITGDLAEHIQLVFDRAAAQLKLRNPGQAEQLAADLRPSSEVISQTRNMLQNKVKIDPDATLNTWVIDGRRVKKRPILACRNGLLVLDSDNPQLLDHSPNWFSTSVLPFDYTEGAGCPLFKASLKTILNDEQGAVDFMQEWFGYHLWDNEYAQSFLILLGRGFNGKSMLLAVLRAFIGEENVSAVGLADFGKDFGLSPTVGKKANISGDMGRVDQTAVGHLKKYTGGDLLTINRKHLPSITLKPTAKLTFATNVKPHMHDPSDGTWRRLHLLEMQYVIPAGERNPRMVDVGWWVDSGELPGILNWALEGMRRLKEKKWAFTETDKMRADKAQYRQEMSGVLTFKARHIRVVGGREDFVRHGAAYTLYQEFCKRTGLNYVASEAEFYEEFESSLAYEMSIGKVVKDRHRPDPANRNEKPIVYFGLKYV